MVNSLFALAWLLRSQGEYNRARVLCEESLALSGDLGDTRRVADAQLLMAQMLFDTQATPTLVLSQIEDVLALYRQVHDEEGIAACLHLLGQITLLQGETEKARSWFEQSVALHKELGHQAGLAWAVPGLARVVLALSDYVAAQSYHVLAIRHIRSLTRQCSPSHFAGVIRLFPPSYQGLAASKRAMVVQVWPASTRYAAVYQCGVPLLLTVPRGLARFAASAVICQPCRSKDTLCCLL